MPSETNFLCQPPAQYRNRRGHIIQYPNLSLIGVSWLERDGLWSFNNNTGLMNVATATARGLKYVGPMMTLEDQKAHHQRITELHEANNREVEAHRETKAELRKLRAILEKAIGSEKPNNNVALNAAHVGLVTVTMKMVEASSELSLAQGKLGEISLLLKELRETLAQANSPD